MKKIILLVAVAGLSVLATSCAKSRTCTCSSTTISTTVTTTNVGSSTTSSSSSASSVVTIDKLKKKDARRQQNCISGKTTDIETKAYGSGNSAYTTTDTDVTDQTCTLK